MATGGIGLTLERTQLTTNFTKQILQSSEIALGRHEATLGLFLAPAVLQNARGFFDNCPTLFWSSVEHRIDLALRNDHMLLTTNATIGKKILDVEESTRHAVQRVFTVARTEQRAGDRDLTELDREHPRRVVDGQADFSAPESSSLCRASKNHIVHFL